jgi:hypothetical protein
MSQNYFVVFLNLARDIEKRIKMENMLKDKNINYIRFEGIDFKNGTNIKYVNKNYIVEPNMKEICITLSYFEMFDFLDKNHNYDYYIFMEDDVDLCYIDNFDNEIQTCINNIPVDWEYISLHSSNKKCLLENINLYNKSIYYKKIDRKFFGDNSTVSFMLKKNSIKELLLSCKKSDYYVFDYNEQYTSIVRLIRFFDNMYIYTKPIIKVRDGNINTCGVENPHDYIANNIIVNYWKKKFA